MSEEYTPEEPVDLVGGEFVDLPDEQAKVGQVMRLAFLRGFDPDSATATFAYSCDGKMREIAAVIDEKNPMGREMHRLLLQTLASDGQVPALQIRLSLSADEREPAALVFAQTATPESENRFLYQGTEMRWTHGLDEAVDSDFDCASQEFAIGYIGTMLESPDPVAAFSSCRTRALALFVEEAAKLGIRDAEAAFDAAAPRTVSEALLGNERCDSGTRQVRYDTRYGFAQQSAHVRGGRNDAILSALANYACQQSITVTCAELAMDNVDFGNGKVGSLAEQHQTKLIQDHLLLAPNPTLGTYRSTFSAYSHETVRLAASRIVAGAMDCAGVPSSRPELDQIEAEKRFGDPKTSFHQMANGSLPENVEGPARAGAYLATARDLTNGMREQSKEQVARAQGLANPPKNVVAPKFDQKNALATAGTSLLKKTEALIDML